MVERRTTRRFAAMAAVTLALASGCGTTSLHLETAPAPTTLGTTPLDTDDVPIAMDGFVLRSGRADLALPYFGTMQVSTTPAPTSPDPASPLDPLTRGTVMLVRHPAPVTPWLFPFDFPLELLGRTVGLISNERTVTIPIERQPEVSPDAEPPELEELRARAHAATLAR